MLVFMDMGKQGDEGDVLKGEGWGRYMFQQKFKRMWEFVVQSSHKTLLRCPTCVL